MSIAVRASVVSLVVLLLLCAAVGFWALTQRQTLLGQNQRLEKVIADDQSKLADLTTRAKKLEDDAQELNSKISQAQQEKSQVQSQYDEIKTKSDDLQSQLTQANSDRDDWKNRVDTITHERDSLMDKLKNQQVKIVYRDRIVQAPASASAASSEGDNTPAPAAPVAAADVTSNQGEQYWASVLKQKAALQIEVEKEKSALDQAALQVVDLKKQNSDLQTEIKQISNEKDEIVQKIKYGQDLADNLSIDLARSRNDQQAVNDRADKLKEENLQLLSQIRELNSTKFELEKTVSRLTDEKGAMQKKLVETESVIQSRIDDIWKIKQSLDKKLSENSPTSSVGSMELPPIIVNAPNNQQQVVAAAPSSSSTSMVKTEGSIISMNESNNFVIVDIGQENSPVSIGNVLKVYRDSNQIGALEVIQVRRDICAADIKNSSTGLKVGDIVRFN